MDSSAPVSDDMAFMLVWHCQALHAPCPQRIQVRHRHLCARMQLHIGDVGLR